MVSIGTSRNSSSSKNNSITNSSSRSNNSKSSTSRKTVSSASSSTLAKAVEDKNDNDTSSSAISLRIINKLSELLKKIRRFSPDPKFADAFLLPPALKRLPICTLLALIYQFTFWRRRTKTRFSISVNWLLLAIYCFADYPTGVVKTTTASISTEKKRRLRMCMMLI